MTKNNKERIKVPREAILLINGEINIPFFESYICKYLNDLPIYCADGAFNQIKGVETLFKKVKMIIGDGDSIIDMKNCGVPYKKFSNQDSTDFDKSLRWLLKNRYNSIFLFGFGGKEMDHYLGNLSTLLKYKHYFKFKLIDCYSVAELMYKNMCINNVKGKMISIVPLFKLNKLTLQGFAFNLENYTLRFGEKIGIRNYALLDVVNIKYKNGNGLLFLSHNSNFLKVNHNVYKKSI